MLLARLSQENLTKPKIVCQEILTKNRAFRAYFVNKPWQKPFNHKKSPRLVRDWRWNRWLEHYLFLWPRQIRNIPYGFVREMYRQTVVPNHPRFWVLSSENYTVFAADTISLSLSKSFPTSVVVAFVTAVAVIGASLLAYFKKCERWLIWKEPQHWLLF